MAGVIHVPPSGYCGRGPAQCCIDVTKTAVERDGEMAAAKAALQAARDMQMFRKEDGAGIGRPPENGLIIVVPGKDAVPVCFEQPFRLEIAADGK